ncbi:hypothetical protein [Priestia sp. YIM B13448]|uniref:hypothetical protein n=1 Tax=Priestia sp. YIM B13448 TaxID=3366308 RepID=UPI0036706FAB
MAYNKYPLAFKLKIITELIMNEKTKGIKSKLAKKYGVSEYSVRNWAVQYRENIDFQINDEKQSFNQKPSVLVENEVLKAIIIQKEIEINELRKAITNET